MNQSLSEKEAIFRFTKIYIAQYLSTIRTFLSHLDNFESFHD